jgi:hypothetical protein
MLSKKDFENLCFGCDNAEAVDLSSTDYTPTHTVRRLYVGGAGNVKVDTIGGQTLTFQAAPVGFLDVRAKKVYKTGTTATNIVALW